MADIKEETYLEQEAERKLLDKRLGSTVDENNINNE